MTRGFVWPDAATWGWTIVVGLAGLAAHFSLARAFSLADAIIVAPMDFLRVPLIAIVGALIYAEPLNPWVLGGGAIILAANTLNIVAERKR
jgi:drug/metabolite transporter (DMT)-like permease